MAAIGQVRTAPSTVRTPLFLVGVGLALFAFVAMFAFGIVFVRGSQSGRNVSVVVAAQDIAPRQPITPDLLSISNVPASALQPHAMTSVVQLSGFSALVAISKGQAITSNVVSSNPDEIALGGPTEYLPIPSGYVAITLPTSEQQGVAGYIAPADYIDIVATVNIDLILLNPNGSSSVLNHRQVTRTVFPGVKVIRVGPPSTAPKQGQPQGVASSITVLMTLCDAQYMNWLIQNAALKYVLLSYKDYDTNPPQPDTSCPSTASPEPIGPKAVDARWNFTKG